MNQLERDIAEARKNFAAAEQREKERLAAIVREASAEVDQRYEARMAAERAAEQAQERARQQREDQQESDARAAAERSYLAAGGAPADFDQWYAAERQRQVTERIERERAAARYHMQKTF